MLEFTPTGVGCRARAGGAHWGPPPSRTRPGGRRCRRAAGVRAVHPARTGAPGPRLHRADAERRDRHRRGGGDRSVPGPGDRPVRGTGGDRPERGRLLRLLRASPALPGPRPAAGAGRRAAPGVHGSADAAHPEGHRPGPADPSAADAGGRAVPARCGLRPRMPSQVSSRRALRPAGTRHTERRLARPAGPAAFGPAPLAARRHGRRLSPFPTAASGLRSGPRT
jgi:hypothetical protein